MNSIPKQILGIAVPPLFFLREMGPEFIFMTGKFIETYIAVLKSGHVTSYEQLLEKVIEKMEEVEKNHPFFD